jgi:ABC-type amino acid transport substrate-binding protein
MRTLIVLAASLLSGAHACAGTLDRVRETGVFTIAYRADARPYSYRTEKGEPAGYIVDLCREVAASVREHVGKNIETIYQVVPASQRFETVRDGRADILCDPSTVTIARRELVDFSVPTYIDGAGVLSRDSKPIQRFEDLKGKRVGVLGGTTTEQLLRRTLADMQIGANLTVVRDHREGIELLTADRLDGYFADRGILSAFVAQGNLPGFRIARQYFSYETYALALPRDDSAFRLLVDRTLARLYRSGRVRALLTKAFGRLQPDEMLNTLIAIHSVPEQ